jgi:prepilin-type N-terminal cleavage/methylation domain-containing protein
MMGPGRRIAGQAGFSLAELLVATAVVGIVMAGLVGLLSSSQSAYSRGTNTVDAQQNARVALERLAKEIREAGYHPRPPDTSPATCPPGPGNLYPSGGATDAPCWLFYPIVSPTATSLTLQYDWNGDGVITAGSKVNDPISCPAGAGCRGERVTYTLSGQTLTRQETGVDASAQPVATGITSLAFTYLQADGTTTASLDLIRSVRIQITAQSGSSGAFAAMTDQIRLRAR